MNIGNITLVPEISDKQLEWRNNPAVWLTCRQNHMIDRMTQSEWLVKIRQDPTMFVCGIYDKSIHQIIGTGGLTSISRHHRTAEFSLLIGPEFQGKGYSKPALIHLLNYGFLRLDLELIYGEAINNNEKALNSYEAVGFKKEGVLRSRYYKLGKRYDSTMFSMTKDEFIALNHPLMYEINGIA